jgi:hypothetical protein
LNRRYKLRRINAITNRIQVTTTGDKLVREILRTMARNPHKKAVTKAKKTPFLKTDLSDIHFILGWLKYINIVWTLFFNCMS